jgi:hypothetical protein
MLMAHPFPEVTLVLCMILVCYVILCICQHIFSVNIAIVIKSIF